MDGQSFQQQLTAIIHTAPPHSSYPIDYFIVIFVLFRLRLKHESRQLWMHQKSVTAIIKIGQLNQLLF